MAPPKAKFSDDSHPGLEKFSRLLISEVKAERINALKRLQQFIAFRNTQSVPFSMLDMKKVWKCLYYCMWMCDKMLNQQALSKTLSSLTHLFSDINQKLLFVDVYFMTISREWSGLDTHRQDKYLFLSRVMFRAGVKVLKSEGLSDASIGLFTDLFTHRVFTEHKPIATAVEFHVCDVYFEEISKVFKGDITNDYFFKLAAPLLHYLRFGRDKGLCNHIIDNVFLELPGFDSVESKGALFKHVGLIQVDRNDFVEKVKFLAGDSQTLDSNRKFLYFLAKSFAAQTGKLPQLEQDRLKRVKKRKEKRKRKFEKAVKSVEVEEKKRKLDKECKIAKDENTQIDDNVCLEVTNVDEKCVDTRESESSGDKSLVKKKKRKVKSESVPKADKDLEDTKTRIESGEVDLSQVSAFQVAKALQFGAVQIESKKKPKRRQCVAEVQKNPENSPKKKRTSERFFDKAKAEDFLPTPVTTEISISPRKTRSSKKITFQDSKQIEEAGQVSRNAKRGKSVGELTRENVDILPTFTRKIVASKLGFSRKSDVDIGDVNQTREPRANQKRRRASLVERKSAEDFF